MKGFFDGARRLIETAKGLFTARVLAAGWKGSFVAGALESAWKGSFCTIGLTGWDGFLNELAKEFEWPIKAEPDGGAREEEARDWKGFPGSTGLVWRGAKGSDRASELLTGRGANGCIGGLVGPGNGEADVWLLPA